MVQSITINFSDIKNGSGRIQVENSNIIKNIFADYKDNTLTSKQFNQLLRIAAIDGKKDVLECCDTKNGTNRLKSDIIQNKASLDPKWLGFIGNNTIYVNVPKGTTMSSIKKMYNLPDGALLNYCKVAGCPGGNRDQFVTIADNVWFTLEDFAKGNDIDVDTAKKLFNK